MSLGGLFGGENRPSDTIDLYNRALGSLGKDGSQRTPVRGVGMYHQRRSSLRKPPLTTYLLGSFLGLSWHQGAEVELAQFDTGGIANRRECPRGV
jgi:hypothetical protein